MPCNKTCLRCEIKSARYQETRHLIINLIKPCWLAAAPHKNDHFLCDVLCTTGCNFRGPCIIHLYTRIKGHSPRGASSRAAILYNTWVSAVLSFPGRHGVHSIASVCHITFAKAATRQKLLGNRQHRLLVSFDEWKTKNGPVISRLLNLEEEIDCLIKVTSYHQQHQNL
jgi:hypothetical protein